jgi:hypothetical protein
MHEFVTSVFYRGLYEAVTLFLGRKLLIISYEQKAGYAPLLVLTSRKRQNPTRRKPNTDFRIFNPVALVIVLI